ncbi:MAG: SEL1-like repeat protein [Alphaproteobacteria bacterium]|nr:SEL1-like repeat protein [Alphaproteobacteria bacterium]
MSEAQFPTRVAPASPPEDAEFWFEPIIVGPPETSEPDSGAAFRDVTATSVLAAGTLPPLRPRDRHEVRWQDIKWIAPTFEGEEEEGAQGPVTQDASGPDEGTVDPHRQEPAGDGGEWDHTWQDRSAAEEPPYSDGSEAVEELDDPEAWSFRDDPAEATETYPVPAWLYPDRSPAADEDADGETPAAGTWSYSEQADPSEDNLDDTAAADPWRDPAQIELAWDDGEAAGSTAEAWSHSDRTDAPAEDATAESWDYPEGAAAPQDRDGVADAGSSASEAADEAARMAPEDGPAYSGQPDGQDRAQGDFDGHREPAGQRQHDETGLSDAAEPYRGRSPDPLQGALESPVDEDIEERSEAAPEFPHKTPDRADRPVRSEPWSFLAEPLPLEEAEDGASPLRAATEPVGTAPADEAAPSARAAPDWPAPEAAAPVAAEQEASAAAIDPHQSGTAAPLRQQENGDPASASPTVTPSGVAPPGVTPPGVAPSEVMPSAGGPSSVASPAAAPVRIPLPATRSWPVALAAGVAGLLLVGAAAYYRGDALAGFFAVRPAPVAGVSAPPPGAAPVESTAPPSASAPGQAATDGPPKEPAQRAAYFLARAKAGDPVAQHDVGVLYAEGDGLAQDYASAAAWFREAAINGVVNAQYNLAVLYDRGLGVPKNMSEALIWYRSAADRNHPAAQYNLALAYAEGRGTPQDYVQAARWYHRAADQGIVPAMVNFAILYERGEGVEASPLDAYAWYRAAARRGDEIAEKRAGELHQQFSAEDKVKADALAASVATSIHAPAPDPGPVKRAAAVGGGPEPVLKTGGAGRHSEATAPDLDPKATPASDQSPNARMISEIQSRLARLDPHAGAVDGIAGHDTMQAIRRYQQSQGLTVDGNPSIGLLNHMRSTSAPPSPAARRDTPVAP